MSSVVQFRAVLADILHVKPSLLGAASPALQPSETKFIPTRSIKNKTAIANLEQTSVPDPRLMGEPKESFLDLSVDASIIADRFGKVAKTKTQEM